MKEFRDLSINEGESVSSVQENETCGTFEVIKNREVKGGSKIIQITPDEVTKPKAETFLVSGKETQNVRETSNLLLRKNSETQTSITSAQNYSNLFRLFVKRGEYVYARPNDIIMMESCDHWVKVYVTFNDSVKKTIRHNTLKDLLLLLPKNQFMRIGRFCAVNMHRLSGGNCNEQTFEFDFKVSIKLKRSVSNAVFAGIGK